MAWLGARWTRRIGMLAAAFGLFGLGFVTSIWSPADTQKSMHITEEMKPVCVGRFLIGLPARAQVHIGHGYTGGFHLASVPGESREPNFTTGYSFREEMRGRQDDICAPVVSLELVSGTDPMSGGKPVQSSLSEAEMFRIWDRILRSIRIRPSALPNGAVAAN